MTRALQRGSPAKRLAGALAIALAGCASVSRDEATGQARDWSQRIDAAAPQLHESIAQREALSAQRERLLEEPLTEPRRCSWR